MDILAALREEASKLQQQLDTIHAAMDILKNGSKSSGVKKKGVSAAARARMSQAARKRWKKIKAAKRATA